VPGLWARIKYFYFGQQPASRIEVFYSQEQDQKESGHVALNVREVATDNLGILAEYGIILPANALNPNNNV